jgi:GNAT superfamily N-acetyltransferase
MNLDQFLSSKWPPNIWIREHSINVYVRKSVRLIGTETYPMLDIGSVEVEEEERGKGIFTAFLSRFEKEAKKLGRGVYIESILNPRFQKFLLTKGYALVPRTSDISPSMYKLFT